MEMIEQQFPQDLKIELRAKQCLCPFALSDGDLQLITYPLNVSRWSSSSLFSFWLAFAAGKQAADFLDSAGYTNTKELLSD